MEAYNYTRVIAVTMATYIIQCTREIGRWTAQHASHKPDTSGKDGLQYGHNKAEASCKWYERYKTAPPRKVGMKNAQIRRGKDRGEVLDCSIIVLEA